MATRHWLLSRMHAWLQDGGTVHLFHHRGCCDRGFVGYPGLQKGPQHGKKSIQASGHFVNQAFQEQLWKHFFARAFALILFPFIVYLSFFWIHFKILKFSGPGDSFMSPAFQETLYGNELLTSSEGKHSTIQVRSE